MPPFGLSLVEYLAGGFGLAIAVGILSFGVMKLYQRGSDGEEFDFPTDDSLGEPGEEFEPPRHMSPPEMRRSSSRLGLVGELWRMKRIRDKRQKYLGDGYVMWYLVGDTFPTPRFVKPELERGGIPEYEIDGERYLFPRSAALPTESEGFWTYVHQKGDADPVNLNEPKQHSLPADAVEEWTTMRPAASPPSWLDSLGLDFATTLRYGLIVIIVYAAIRSAISNGLVPI